MTHGRCRGAALTLPTRAARTGAPKWVWERVPDRGIKWQGCCPWLSWVGPAGCRPLLGMFQACCGHQHIKEYMWSVCGLHMYTCIHMYTHVYTYMQYMHIWIDFKTYKCSNMYTHVSTYMQYMHIWIDLFTLHVAHMYHSYMKIHANIALNNQYMHFCALVWNVCICMYLHVFLHVCCMYLCCICMYLYVLPVCVLYLPTKGFGCKKYRQIHAI
jgi:hypothetical protein